MAQDRELTSLRELIDELRARLEGTMNPEFKEQLDYIETDHRRLVDFRLKGIKDGKRDEIYSQLLEKARRLRANYFMDLYCARPGFREARALANRETNGPINAGYIREFEEAFMKERTMLALKPKEEQAKASLGMYEEHFKSIEQIFSYLLTSYQWTEAEAEDYLSLFLSPTCDSVDLQVMVSAITLNMMRSFDAAKAWVLGNLYAKSLDERVRQRAFVGWAFSLPVADTGLHKMYTKQCEELMARPEVRQDLLDLQKQYLLCMDIEKDCEKLEKDIFPRIMRNSPFDITPSGIKEKARSVIDDILKPDDEDMKIKEIEACMETIQKMKETGADIYYASFSKLKGDIFFQKLVNWFTPFYKEHPMIRVFAENIKGNKLFDMISSHMVFCDSDCYSFISGASAIVKKLPEDMRQAFFASELPDNMMPQVDKDNPAHVRLMYLHDLFRFARLHPLSKYFISPFDELRTKYPIMIFQCWHGETCQDEKYEIAKFLFAQKKYRDFRRAISSLDGMNTADYHLMLAGYYKYLWDSGLDADMEKKELEADIKRANAKGDYAAQVENYFQEDLKVARERFFDHITVALSLDKENISGLRILGNAQRAHDMLDDAAKTFKRILELRPDNKKAIFDYAAVLLKMGNGETAANYVYKLSFEMPNHPDVMRLQAWLHLLRNQPEKAQVIYKQLMKDDGKLIDEDILNAGYCAWFLDNWEEAANCFVTFMKHVDKGKDGIHKFFLEDANLFEIYMIDVVDRYIMEDLVMERM